jgi:hypothetical protein
MGHIPMLVYTRSHQEMLKSKSMGGTANTCSQYCVEHLAGYLVLSSGKDVFRLDRADLVHGFEGQKVRVTGVLDPKLKQDPCFEDGVGKLEIRGILNPHYVPFCFTALFLPASVSKYTPRIVISGSMGCR